MTFESMRGAAFVAQLARCRMSNCLYFDKLIGVTEHGDAKQCARGIVIAETACDFIPRYEEIIPTAA